MQNIQNTSEYYRLCVPADYFTVEIQSTTPRRSDFTFWISTNDDDDDCSTSETIVLEVRLLEWLYTIMCRLINHEQRITQSQFAECILLVPEWGLKCTTNSRVFVRYKPTFLGTNWCQDPLLWKMCIVEYHGSPLIVVTVIMFLHVNNTSHHLKSKDWLHCS